jgi:hypothetical protein
MMNVGIVRHTAIKNNYQFYRRGGARPTAADTGATRGFAPTGLCCGNDENHENFWNDRVEAGCPLRVNYQSCYFWDRFSEIADSDGIDP